MQGVSDVIWGQQCSNPEEAGFFDILYGEEDLVSGCGSANRIHKMVSNADAHDYGMQGDFGDDGKKGSEILSEMDVSCDSAVIPEAYCIPDDIQVVKLCRGDGKTRGDFDC